MKNELDDANFLVVQEDIQERKSKVWRKPAKNAKGFIEIEIPKLSERQLEVAYKTACGKELHYHNRTMIFSQLIDELESEAESRGITLEVYDSNFHRNKVKLRKRQNVT